MNQTDAKGKKFLLVVGIILIVLAAFSALGVAGTAFTLVSFNSSDAAIVQQLEQTLAATGVTKEMLQISMGFSIVTVIVYLLAGILGIKNRNKPEKAKSCVIMAAIMILLVLASAGYSVMTGTFTVWSVALNLVLPLLYLWGAMQNMQSK